MKTESCRKVLVSRVIGNLKNDLSGFGVYQDLGHYFRLADHPPKGALALEVVSVMAIYRQLRTEAAD